VLSNTLNYPARSAAILNLLPDDHPVRILGIKNMMGSLAAILGPALIAALSSSIDARGIFLAALGVVLLTTLIGSTYPVKVQHIEMLATQIPAAE
jgi:MFS family permease